MITNQLISYLNENLVLTSNESILLVTGNIDTQINNLARNDQLLRNDMNSAVAEVNSQMVSLRASSVTHDEMNEGLAAHEYSILQVADSKISASVGDLEKNIKTNMELKTDGLHLRKEAGSTYEALLTNEELAFVLASDTSKKAASFGAEGAYADRLRSNKQLSVGTTDNGWFDFIMVKNGLAEKWRTEQTVKLPAYISRQPASMAGTNAVVLSIEGNGDTFTWQYSSDGESWSTFSHSDSDSKNCTVSLSATNVLNVYRCGVSTTVTVDGVTSTTSQVYSDAVSVYDQSAPGVIVFVNGTSMTATALTSSTVTYAWYKKNDNDVWEIISNETTNVYTGTSGESYRCLVASNGHYAASEIIQL